MRSLLRSALLLLSVALGLAACAPRSEGGPGANRPRTLETLRPLLTRDLTPETARRRLGEPDEVLGSGLLIFRYRVEGGRSVLLGFPGDAPLLYAKLDDGHGTITGLPLR
jgi:hypothetical protein